MAKTIALEYGVPGYHVVWVPGFLGYDAKLPKYEYSLDKAKQLMGEAGFAGGVNVNVAMDVSSAADQKVAEVLQAMWEKVGIRATLSPMESAAFKAAAQAGQHEAVTTNAFPSPDPDAMARVMVCGGSANWCNYCNSKLDDCMKGATAIYDEKQRAEAYGKCQQILYDDAGIYGTVHIPWNVVYRKEVQNLKTNQHLLDVREVWLEK